MVRSASPRRPCPCSPGHKTGRTPHGPWPRPSQAAARPVHQNTARSSPVCVCSGPPRRCAAPAPLPGIRPRKHSALPSTTAQPDASAHVRGRLDVNSSSCSRGHVMRRPSSSAAKGKTGKGLPSRRPFQGRVPRPRPRWGSSPAGNCTPGGSTAAGPCGPSVCNSVAARRPPQAAPYAASPA